MLLKLLYYPIYALNCIPVGKGTFLMKGGRFTVT